MARAALICASSWALWAGLLVTTAGAENKPIWLTDRTYDELGRPELVPKPWTPVAAEGQRFSVWGRTYRWTPASLLPSSIRTQGAELLVAPMRLVCFIKGKKAVVPMSNFRLTERHPSRVSFVASGGIKKIRFRLEGWIEYDGFLWLTLRPEAPASILVEALYIETPLQASLMTLYQAFARPLAGFIGIEPICFPWLASRTENIVDFYHWFGNEDLGLGFTYATLEHWAPASEENVATFYPGPKQSLYRIRLIEQPVSLTGRVFSFGLQATPIKPLPPGYWAMLAATYYREPWRASEQLKPHMDMMLVWPLETGIMKGLNDPYGLDKARMAALVQEAHKAGLPMLSIAACPQKISPHVPELSEYREEWRTEPESVLDWEGQPQLQNCGRSETLRRWLFYGWAIENVQRLGTDGLYFDGWQAGTIACANARHGCGWTDEQGRRHLTVPVLEGREFNQRMLLFLQQEYARRKAAASANVSLYPLHYWIHSWEFVPPVMGFATEWLTGEFAGWPLQGVSMLKPEGTYGKALGLGLFRARCLSTNWGMPNLFDTLMWEAEKDCPRDRQTHQAFAWLLPHGVPFGMIHYMNANTTVKILRVLIAHKWREARFTPGWKPNPFWQIVRPRRREIMLATWDHGPSCPLLAVLSNLQTETTETITFRWQGRGRPFVTDALTQEPLQGDGKTFNVRLEAESFILLSATPEER